MQTIEQILLKFITDNELKLISDYQISALFFTLPENQTRELQIDYPLIKTTITGIIERLISLGLLQLNKSFPVNKIYNIIGQKPSVEEISCITNPFSYISHLSAIEHHGLTNRISQTLFLSSPPDKKWNELAKQTMSRDLSEFFPDYMKSRLPRLKRIHVEKINKHTLNIHKSSYLGAFKSHNNIRVSKIGRTFLDMIREPNLCGGIEHVLDLYQEHAEKYLRLIMEEINRNGKKTEKVRAGYILTERCNLDHPLIHEWEQCAQRGGSQKLDPSAEYSPEYSERWNLSINTIT
jgi:predicted transcriptional regulator of viral defense system